MLSGRLRLFSPVSREYKGNVWWELEPVIISSETSVRDYDRLHMFWDVLRPPLWRSDNSLVHVPCLLLTWNTITLHGTVNVLALEPVRGFSVTYRRIGSASGSENSLNHVGDSRRREDPDRGEVFRNGPVWRSSKQLLYSFFI